TDGEHRPGRPGDRDVGREAVGEGVACLQGGLAAAFVEAAETEIGDLVPVDVVDFPGERRIRGGRETFAATVPGAGRGGELDLADVGRRRGLGADVRWRVRAAFLGVGKERRYPDVRHAVRAVGRVAVDARDHPGHVGHRAATARVVAG